MHEYGILTEGGSGTGGHFNPLNAQHGCYRADMPSDVARKVGDLGNVEHGEYLSAENSLIKLDGGEQSVLGRSVVLHLNEDNCEPFEGIFHCIVARKVNIGIDIGCCKPTSLIPFCVPSGQLGDTSAGPRIAQCTIGIIQYVPRLL